MGGTTEAAAAVSAGSARKSSQSSWSPIRVAFVCLVVSIVVIEHVPSVDAIYPEYELDRRFEQLLQAVQNTMEDKAVLRGDSLPKDLTSLVTFRCRETSTSSFVRVRIGDRRLGRKVDLSKPVVVLIHGWFDSHDRSWINGTATIYQTFMEANVCTVDWGRLALTEYSMAAKNTRVVAQELVKFLAFLRAHGVHLDDVTLVGHSFGGQVAGHAGAMLGGKVGRIFGLDPAGWAFTKPTVVDTFHRLDKTDAQYVQCIHTNRDFLGLGTHLECGHQDFYPNNGMAPQPGCLNPREEGGASLLITTCSHFKSLEFFAMSLDPRTKIKGWHCAGGYNRWRSGLCHSKKFDYIGVHTKNKVAGKLYLQIEARRPFAL